MRLISVVAAAAAFLPSLTVGSRLTPPVLPLIVRNPYLSTWLANARGLPWEQWPMFWTGQEIGLSVLASLPEDRKAYPLLGRPQDSLDENDDGYNISYAHYKGATYDASTTNLTYHILPSEGKKDWLEITLSFLSPVTPTSTFRQAIPAAYVSVYVKGTVDVDIYIDLNGQWVSGDRGSKIEWALDHVHLHDDEHHVLKTWRVRRSQEQDLTEYLDRAEWGTLHFSAPLDVKHESGTSETLRKRFSRTGTLQNLVDDDFRTIMDNEPVFAFAKSFNLANSSKAYHERTTEGLTLSIAHTQETVIKFASARGMTMMRPLWASYMPKIDDMLAYHYLDFDDAFSLASNYSSLLEIDAFQSGAEDYVDIVTLSARQVMGACTFAGTPDGPLIFMKEISSDGNTQTIDVIFPAFPFFLYTNPRWLAYLLEPLLEHMMSGQYPNTYAMHDLGTHFPNATGHPDGRDEYMPVEECGNILIMGLALVNSIKFNTGVASPSSWTATHKASVISKEGGSIFPLTVGTGDGIAYIDEVWRGGPQSLQQAEQWVKKSYRLWKQWTGYLVDFSLRPQNQLSTDDFAGWLALQTNLALKGIIGIKAMAGLAEVAGYKDDAKQYNNISRGYIKKWEDYGISRDKTHAKVAYDWFGSWTTTYNLYADSLLCFHLGDISSNDSGDDNKHQKPIHNRPTNDKSGFVPKHIYQMQSDWYYNVRQKYGLPLDSRHLYTKTDWEFFAMAIAAPKVRAFILESVAKWVNETSTDRPLTDLHLTEGHGGFPGPNFFARPVIGGHFAFLALERACDGKAMEGLRFLDDSIVRKIDVARVLAEEKLGAEIQLEL